MSALKRYYPVLMVLLMALLPLGLNTYWIEVAVNVGLYALLALSLNVILGQAGIFHMGHAAFYAVGAYVTAINGQAAGPNTGWTYTVNGAQPNVSCSSYEVSIGDAIVWEFVTVG